MFTEAHQTMADQNEFLDSGWVLLRISEDNGPAIRVAKECRKIVQAEMYPKHFKIFRHMGHRAHLGLVGGRGGTTSSPRVRKEKHKVLLKRRQADLQVPRARTPARTLNHQKWLCRIIIPVYQIL